MSTIAILNNQVKIDPLFYYPKKITGTRLASVLGYNKYCSPFEVWCDIVGVYKKPFKGSIYTNAGRIIEPKQVAYLKSVYPENDIKSAADKYGPDYLRATHGDFFITDPIFGGMWDAAFFDNMGPRLIAEMKTMGKPIQGIPLNYWLQCSLYAHLVYSDRFCIVQTQLTKEAYDNPEAFEVNPSNTRIDWSGIYPGFDNLLKHAEDWYRKHVCEGISPIAQTEEDMKILGILERRMENGDI